MGLNRLLVLVTLLGGCATAQPRAYTLDLSQIPEGYNCFPVVPIRQTTCGWRLKSAVETLLGTTLDRELGPAGQGWSARFELLDLRFFAGPANTDQATSVAAIYRFKLTDRSGRVVIDSTQRLAKDFHELVTSQLRGPYDEDQLKPASDVIGTGTDVYYLLEDINRQLGKQLQAALAGTHAPV